MRNNDHMVQTMSDRIQSGKLLKREKLGESKEKYYK
jgi:hypothetical protein